MVRKPAIRADKPELTTSNSVSSESNAISPIDPIGIPVTQYPGLDQTVADRTAADWISDRITNWPMDHGSDYGLEQVKKTN